MALSALPTEILSRICRFIIWEDALPIRTSPFGGLPLRALPQDFKSLRLSCKNVYEKTLFDAAIVYGGILENLTVEPTYKALSRLLSISSAPHFRDRIRGITFYLPVVEYRDISRYCEAEYARILDCEEQYTFASSPEAIYMLTETFKNLAKSTSLLKVRLCAEATYPAVFAALNNAAFHRQIVHVEVKPAIFREFPHNRFLNPLFESHHLISHIEFEAKSHPDHGCMEPGMGKRDVAHNENGRHYSGYKPITYSLSRLAGKLSSVTEIAVYGCDAIPRLRLCHGCEDIWVSFFAKNTYSHLTYLKLCSTYVSGSRLRGFIKRCAGKLQHIKFDLVYLTDGTWRSIAQGLQKCPNLEYLYVGSDDSVGSCTSSLRQKHAAPALAVSLPEEYLNTRIAFATGVLHDGWIYDLVLCNKEDVVHWLDIFVRYFATTESDVHEHFGPAGYELPVYHEANTFLLPNRKLGVPYYRTRAHTAMNRYLEAAEEA